MVVFFPLFFKKYLTPDQVATTSTFWLGIANLRLGDVKAARQHIALAESTSTTPEARRTYSAKLAHLRAMKGSDQ